ncbi:MAG: TlpA family protein disulfide reductase [Microlunatus sp.]|nr:TlpA family protein disulfide reductase [Microlunatus sp.]MDN5771586.1 TlpA family protein disulfide reductase [Microlunatus sp.]
MPESVRPRIGAVLAALLATLTLFVVAGCSSVAADEPTRTGNSEGYVGVEKSVTLIPPDKRQSAPPISGERLGGDGKTIDIAALGGKVVVLNVWGSWCGPCRAEAPALQQASEQTAGVAQFVGLNTKDHDQGPAEAFNRAFGITYPSIWDPTGSILVSLSDTLPPKGIPSTLIIDREGRVAARIVGTVTETTLVDLITDVAAGR